MCFGVSMNIAYIAHGGGPMPLLGDPGHLEMVGELESLARQLPRPSAIVVVSAHWEEDKPTVTAGASPSLIYDYYGFPEESYSVTYRSEERRVGKECRSRWSRYH